jgi:hypothetical protein
MLVGVFLWTSIRDVDVGDFQLTQRAARECEAHGATHSSRSRRLRAGIATKRLRRLSEHTLKRLAHPPGIGEACRNGNLIDRMPAFFEHQTRGFKA